MNHDPEWPMDGEDPDLNDTGAERTDPGVREKMASMVGDFISRLLTTGDEGWRKMPIRVPQEIVAYSKEQVSALRQEVAASVRKELGNYFSQLNLSSELLKILTYLTFEVKMQIRLVPTERGSVEIQSRTEVSGIGPETKKP